LAIKGTLSASLQVCKFALSASLHSLQIKGTLSAFLTSNRENIMKRIPTQMKVLVELACLLPPKNVQKGTQQPAFSWSYVPNFAGNPMSKPII